MRLRLLLDRLQNLRNMARLTPLLCVAGVFLPLLLLVMTVPQVGASVGVVMDLKVVSNIEHRYAVTQVSSRMRNPNHGFSQLIFKMTLPENALISSLIIEIDGTNYTSVVREKFEARRMYETGGQSGLSTILVEQGEDNTQKFEVSVNVAAFGVVTFYSTYEEVLRRVEGHYLYTVHIHPGYRIPLARVDVHIVERETIVFSDLLNLPGEELSPHNRRTYAQKSSVNPWELYLRYHHEDPPDGSGKGVDGIFTLSYAIASHTDGGEVQRVGNYFAHYFSPEHLPKLPTHTVFVLDVSHSMYNGKLDNMKAAMKSILKELSPEDSFELLAFSSDVVNVGSYSSKKQEVKKALRKIKRLVSLGYSNLNAALLQAIKTANNYNSRQAVKQIVVFTDGQATSGVTDPESIYRNIQEANINQHPIFTFAFGNDDMKILQHISMDNSGFVRYMHHNSDLASQIKTFYMEVSKPVISGVDITYPESDIDPTSVVKLGTSNYYSGGELVLAGKLIPGATFVHPVVSGIGKDGPQQLPVTRSDSRDPFNNSVKDNFIARLWAYLMLQNLFAKADASENFNHTQRLHAQALQIALRFGFVTRLSSLVVAYPDQYIIVCMKDGIRREKKWHHAYQHESSLSGYRRLGRSNAPGNALQENVDLDPHFIVYAQGIDLPLCFNFHSHSGAFLSLINDPQSGIIVNGQVTSASARPRMTYFTSLFLRLGQVNITITPEGLEIDCLGEDGTPQVNSITKSLWPFYKKNGRRYKHGTDNRLRTSNGKTKKRAKHTMLKKNHAPNQISVFSNDHYSYRRTNNRMTNNRPSSYYTYDRANYQNDISVSNNIVNQHGRFASGDSQYCSQKSSWEEGVGQIYGNVMVVLSKKKNLHVMIGDGLAHFAVVRSKSKNSQRFLGFYIKDQQILSHQTHGIIGQFTAKSVRLISPTTLPVNNDNTESNVKVEVERRNSHNEHRLSVVSGVLSRRRSLLEKTHVKCIHIRGKGRGILDGLPKDYLLNCLRC